MEELDPKYTSKCISCIPYEKEPHLLLYITKLGKIILKDDDQGPIGRSVYVSHEHVYNCEDERFIDIYKDAMKSFIIIQKCLKEVFGSLRCFFCMIGNLPKDENGNYTTNLKYEHRHFHIIPSYPNTIKKEYGIFKDYNYGKPLSFDPERGYPKTKVSKEVLIKIRDEMREWIKKNEMDHIVIPF